MSTTLSPGEMAREIAKAIVTELTATTGRGPTHAKTTMGDDAIFVVLQGSLSQGERNLHDAGQDEAVLVIRRLWQQVMKTRCIDRIEAITQRAVIGFMSDNHIDPDFGVEVFILEPLPKKAKGFV